MSAPLLATSPDVFVNNGRISRTATRNANGMERDANDSDLRSPSMTHMETEGMAEVDGYPPGYPSHLRSLSPARSVLMDDGTRDNSFDFNLYAIKKSAAEGLLDLALLMANASQLKYIVMTEGDHRFYYPMLVLLILSIVLQVVVGVALLFLARMRISLDVDQLKKARRADMLNNLIVAGIFILTVINIFISAFGLNEAYPAKPKEPI